jgi:hypothetical protein
MLRESDSLPDRRAFLDEGADAFAEILTGHDFSLEWTVFELGDCGERFAFEAAPFVT